MSTNKIASEEDIKTMWRLKRMIRKGLIPRRLFARGPNDRLERKPHHKYKSRTKLTWRTVDTLDHFLEDV